MVPEEYGGMGLGPMAYAVITEELSRGWMSVASIIARGGSLPGATEEQKEEYVPQTRRRGR